MCASDMGRMSEERYDGPVELCPQEIVHELSRRFIRCVHCLVLENQIYEKFSIWLLLSAGFRKLEMKEKGRSKGNVLYLPSSHLLFTANVPGTVVLIPL